MVASVMPLASRVLDPFGRHQIVSRQHTHPEHFRAARGHISVHDPVADRTPQPGRTGVLRRAGVAAAGGATVLVGLALIPLPGPGTLVVLGGLAVLRKEFPAAGRAADGISRSARKAVARVTRKPQD